jgi:beta-glucanase (GH16 family)
MTSRQALVLAVQLLCLSGLSFSKFVGWIDPDTPKENHRLKSYVDGNFYELVMSDEFEKDGRTFGNGDDPMWTGVDRSDDDQTASGRKSLQFYNHSYVMTRGGNLVIRTTDEDTKWRGWNSYLKKYVTHERHFRSGMLQSWNKFCYTGGVLETRVQFPGKSDIGGFWPAVWLLGNLGRATFEASTNLMWPWSFDKCDHALQHAQEISACDVTNHFGLNKGQGRGATEIDIIEVMPGPSTALPFVKNNVRRPYNSMTLQLAPGIPTSKRRPQPGTLPEWGFNWYSNLTYGQNTSVNPFFYGTYLSETKSAEPVGRSVKEAYQCDALSSMAQLNESHFQGMHVFRLEWQPGEDGYLRWYIDDEFRFGVDGEGLRKQGTMIPNEPSYIIMNTAISTSWGFPNPPPGCTDYDCKDPVKQCGMNPGWCKTLPAEFKIDYVRLYQNPTDPKQTIGCNPKEYPTKRFIKAHEYRYKGLNEKQALDDVVTGGGECHSDMDCGANYGTGTCQYSIWKFFSNAGWKGCVCHQDFQGPHCLVPTYQNPFEDWDTEKSIPWISPFIPHFLAFWATMFVLALSATLLFAWRWRQQKRAAHLEALSVHQMSHHHHHHHHHHLPTVPDSQKGNPYHRIPTTEMTPIRDSRTHPSISLPSNQSPYQSL